MRRRLDITVGDVIDGAKRYQPFLAAALAVVLVAIVLPNRDRGSEQVAATGGPVGDATVEGTTFDGAGTTVPTGDESTAAGRGGRRTGGGAEVAGGTGAGAFGGADAQTTSTAAAAGTGPDCDAATGRIKVPSLYAPPCPPPNTSNNGGSTAPGVTGDKVRIAIYMGQLDPRTGPILAAAGAADEPDEVWQTYKDYEDYFEKHYATYGRDLELVRIDGGEPDDETAANANAQEIIDKGAFLAVNGPTDTNVYMRKLAAAGIICICTVSQPIETYLENAPYVWGTLMSSTQLYVHRAEYIGKRLWGRNAVHAGDPAFRVRPRTFGLVYFDTAEGTYTRGGQFFQQELTKYGASVKTYKVTGAHVDLSGAQQEAPNVAQALKDEGITSVVFAGDPLYPIFLTQKATEKQYFPEWIVTGSVFSDTAVFGRLYDQAQWRNAFGLSALSARTSEELGEAWRVHLWHHNGKKPVADGTYSGVIYPGFWIAATGIHMAGPNLSVQTFRDGLFAYPRSGNGPVHPSSSFGTSLWPWQDYLRLDDTAEIWWDFDEPGESELGVQGAGLYRYVNKGQRYRAGQWPASDPQVFCCEGNTSLIYESYAAIPDQWPEYQHQPHG